MIRALTNTIVVAILASTILHLSFWGSLKLVSTDHHVPKKENIEIVVLDNTQQTKANPQQIIEQDTRQYNDETPEDTKYLGRFNQVVKKQTRAKHSGKFSNAAGKGQNAKVQSVTPKAKPKRTAKKPQTDGTVSVLSKLVPSFDLDPQKHQKRTAAQPGQRSQTSDHLKDKKVEEGMQTLLSTREFVYYSYYQRIRDKIRQFWEPAIRAKVRKLFSQGRSIASSADRTTRVIIVLNNSGSLVKVQVVGESGVRDLDDAAVEAFRAAEPFPNPPDGIVEKDGMIRIRWDFVLEAMFEEAQDESLTVAGG